MPPEENGTTTSAAQPQTEPRTAPTPTPLPTTDPVFAIRALLDSAGIQKDEQDLGARVRWLITERERLMPLADEGSKLRTKLIESTLEEGVRAFGKEFQKESERADLELLTVSAIERRRDSYKRLADKTIPGNRSTTEGDTAPPLGDGEGTGQQTRVTRPVFAYISG